MKQDIDTGQAGIFHPDHPGHPGHCNKLWDRSYDSWARTDEIVRHLIAHAKKVKVEPYKLAGKEKEWLERIVKEMTEQEAGPNECIVEICRNDLEELENITRKNINTIRERSNMQEEWKPKPVVHTPRHPLPYHGHQSTQEICPKHRTTW